MSKIDVVKQVVGVVVSVGVGSIINDAIKATTPNNVNTFKRICIIVGGFVLSGMVVDKAIDYAENKITSAVEGVKKMVEQGDLDPTEGEA